MKSIKDSKLSFAETNGEGNDLTFLEQSNVMGSIDASAKNDDSGSDEDDSSSQQLPKKKLVKSHT